MSNKLVAGGVLAVIGLVTIKVVMFMVGATVAIFALMFKLLPIVLIVWLIWRLVKRLGRPSPAGS
jgi:hypothetical protein